MITVTRKLEFDAAHRLKDHESLCRYVHGHRYVAEVTFAASPDALDSVGRVIDFGIIKERLGTWLNENWDHTLILCEADRELGEQVDRYTGQTTYYLPNNPTAENMAAHLMHEICPKLFADTGLECQRLRLWETPNCHAEITTPCGSQK